MHRLFALLLISLLPFTAAGESAPGADAQAQFLLQQPENVGASGTSAVPLWRNNHGQWLSLRASHSDATEAAMPSSLAFHGLAAGNVFSSGIQYQLAPGVQAHADISQRSWVNHPARLIDSEVGATYNSGRYSVGLSVGASEAPQRTVLPRVLPGVAPGVDGLSGFDRSEQFNARGRVALGSTTGIDLGASVGRIRLMPGNLLGIDTLDQKALSFGVDSGPLSGTLVGRTMQPLAGGGGAGTLSADQRWSSIDLGVTLRLPWQGALSIGAQNLWSSGNSVNTPVGPEPDQSRTPYVQYHQDL
ncbi:hypothetical protein [Rhodanobacter caeni]|uniref:Uncharacterized protein n=1 Tax=Rhodanobacter caeni TaxID=657654 RepID=A0ABN0U4N5_9GAMM